MLTEYTEQHRTIAAQVGDEFVIALEGNPTTGHEWEARFDHSRLELLDRQYSAEDHGIGAGGTQRFRLKAVAAGVADLRMAYKRSWEKTPARELVFQVRIGA